MVEFSYTAKERHKLFVCFYHSDDESYRNSFAQQFSGDYISKSVEIGDIDTDVSTEYVKRLISENYIADASVVIVLIGPNTHHRKHVDWEISAGLEPGSGRSGLIGILLPTFPNYGNTYDRRLVPPRLQDNVDSGFAKLYWWNQIDGNRESLNSKVDDAFNIRTREDLVVNSRLQMKYNTGP